MIRPLILFLVVVVVVVVQTVSNVNAMCVGKDSCATCVVASTVRIPLFRPTAHRCSWCPSMNKCRSRMTGQTCPEGWIHGDQCPVGTYKQHNSVPAAVQAYRAKWTNRDKVYTIDAVNDHQCVQLAKTVSNFDFARAHELQTARHDECILVMQRLMQIFSQDVKWSSDMNNAFHQTQGSGQTALADQLTKPNPFPNCHGVRRVCTCAGGTLQPCFTHSFAALTAGWYMVGFGLATSDSHYAIVFVENNNKAYVFHAYVELHPLKVVGPVTTAQIQNAIDLIHHGKVRDDHSDGTPTWELFSVDEEYAQALGTNQGRIVLAGPFSGNMCQSTTNNKAFRTDICRIWWKVCTKGGCVGTGDVATGHDYEDNSECSKTWDYVRNTLGNNAHGFVEEAAGVHLAKQRILND